MMRKKKIVFKMVSVFSFQARTQKMNAAIERERLEVSISESIDECHPVQENTNKEV